MKHNIKLLVILMNRKIILIALIVIFLIILVGIIAFAQTSVKTDTQINFMSNASLKNGDLVEFQLLDAQGNALSNQNLSISFGSNGLNEQYSVITDENGKGALLINDEELGNYNVNVSYAGDDRHNPCSASQNITIGDGSFESSAQTSSQSTGDYSSSSSAASSSDSYSSSSSDLQYDSELNVRYDSSGKIVGGQNDGANYEDVKNNRPQVDSEGNLV